MRKIKLAIAILASIVPVRAQVTQLKTAGAVLERYKSALGGVEAVKGVLSQTVHGKIEGTGMPGQTTFVYYAKPFKSLFKVTRADGSQITAGFDGAISWRIDSKGASIDNQTAVDAARRDADLQYALHQPDYFKKLELAGVTDFAGHRCYWLHGTTNWGKDNNQFYDVETGLLAGYRFQADDSSKTVAVAVFQDYKKFGGLLIATRRTTRVGEQSQTLIFESVSYEPIADSMFDLPAAVKALVK